MRRFRKDTIFRVYLIVFGLASVLSVFFLISMQSRLYGRQIELLRSQVSELESRSSVSSPSLSVDSSASSLAEVEKSSSVDLQDLYWIEGTGINKRWWYMDVVFYDGERFRYFLHLPLRRNDLTVFHRRFMHDALFHYRDPVVEDFDSMASDML